jgi:ethanolamine transporter EutH
VREETKRGFVNFAALVVCAICTVGGFYFVFDMAEGRIVDITIWKVLGFVTCAGIALPLSNREI